MLKSMSVLIIVVAMITGISTTAMANTTPSAEPTWVCCSNRETCTVGRLMWNEDGTFMNREAFETRLDELIASGSILEADRSFFLERFDFCSTYGARATGTRGACGRNGHGMRRQGGRCRNR